GRMSVAEEQQPAVTERGGHTWRGLSHDAKFCEERFALVHVVEILAAPRKGLATGARLESAKIDTRQRLQNRSMLRRPIITHHADQAHWAKSTGGRCKVCGTSA
ncbi:MAG: hypothetical protein ACK559_14270, partial [bacterium]